MKPHIMQNTNQLNLQTCGVVSTASHNVCQHIRFIIQASQKSKHGTSMQSRAGKAGAEAYIDCLLESLEGHQLHVCIRKCEGMRQALVPGMEGTQASAVLAEACCQREEQSASSIAQRLALEGGIPQVSDISLLNAKEQSVHLKQRDTTPLPLHTSPQMADCKPHFLCWSTVEAAPRRT
jgi:hypothetical protein